MGRKHSGGKGEIMSNFSFSHSVFKKLVLQTRKPGPVWKRVNMLENMVEKGEKCWLPVFYSFPTISLKGFFIMVLTIRNVWYRIKVKEF